MGLVDRRFFSAIYRRAGSVEDLPWHMEEPPTLLIEAATGRRPARAVDLGCGAGTYAIYLAGQGWEVTAVDFIPEAVELTRRRARDAGVELEAIEADVLHWQAPHAYDLVFDSGCLHGMTGRARTRYKRLLLDRLAADGDFVLSHFTRRHLLDWRPVGPRRYRPEQILSLFRPELELEKRQTALLTGIPLPVGPRALLGTYWLRRP